MKAETYMKIKASITDNALTYQGAGLAETINQLQAVVEEAKAATGKKAMSPQKCAEMVAGLKGVLNQFDVQEDRDLRRRIENVINVANFACEREKILYKREQSMER